MEPTCARVIGFADLAGLAGLSDCSDSVDFALDALLSWRHYHHPIEKPMTSRRERIQAMLADEPDDTFLRYSLALEWAKEGAHDTSLEGLGQLTKEDPPYVPAFFMAAQQLAALGRVDEARSFLRDGIEAARHQGDSHAAGEMSEFLASLGSRGE